MLLASAVVVWEWLNEHGRWRPYSPAVSHHIEAVARAGPRAGGSVVLGQADSRLAPYIIDLQSMHQFRQDTGESARGQPLHSASPSRRAVPCPARSCGALRRVSRPVVALLCAVLHCRDPRLFARCRRCAGWLCGARRPDPTACSSSAWRWRGLPALQLLCALCVLVLPSAS